MAGFGGGARLVGFILAASVVALVAPASADEFPLELSYDLTFGGLTVMSFELAVQQSDAQYAVDFSGRTRGVLSLFGSGYVISSSHGRRAADGRLLPDTFESHSDGNEGEKRSEIRYGPDGPLSWTALPVPGSDGEELTPIPLESIPGTKDILAALDDFAAALGREESCTRSLRIFDGRRRFDLAFTDRGLESVVPEGAGFYAGSARHCHLDLIRIGGYSTDPAKHMSGDDAEFWLAPLLPDEPPVPVEIIFKGRLGLMHARLTRVRHGSDRLGTPEPPIQSAASAPVLRDPR